MLQAASIGILLADAFAYPLAFSMARSSSGEWRALATCTFLAFTCASLPQLLKICERLAETQPKKS
jgi:hypothetical protein